MDYTGDKGYIRHGRGRGCGGEKTSGGSKGSTQLGPHMRRRGEIHILGFVGIAKMVDEDELEGEDLMRR